MNILGVGEVEILVILVVALIFAGPKRMIQWSYTLGQYTAKMRRMWAEAMTMLQKEFKDAGVDVTLPKEIPTRRTINKQVTKALGSVTSPLQEAVDEVNSEVKQIKEAASIADQNGHIPATDTPPADSSTTFGTWSGEGKKDE
jgi:Sec-independent protein translocase protein TatA